MSVVGSPVPDGGGVSLLGYAVVTVRVVVAEDDVFVRAGLRSLLSDVPDFEVVVAVGSLPELLDAVVDHQPDVVLTDIRMPPTHSDEGIQAAQQLRATAPDVAVVALSLYL